MTNFLDEILTKIMRTHIQRGGIPRQLQLYTLYILFDQYFSARCKSVFYNYYRVYACHLMATIKIYYRTKYAPLNARNENNYFILVPIRE